MQDDRKVWSHELEKEKKVATLETLMEWMIAEMKSRMRATAPLRNVSQQRSRSINHITAAEGNKQPNHKCWMCQTSSHWMDQCQKFASMSPGDR